MTPIGAAKKIHAILKAAGIETGPMKHIAKREAFFECGFEDCCFVYVRAVDDNSVDVEVTTDNPMDPRSIETVHTIREILNINGRAVH